MDTSGWKWSCEKSLFDNDLFFVFVVTTDGYSHSAMANRWLFEDHKAVAALATYLKESIFRYVQDQIISGTPDKNREIVGIINNDQN